MTRMYSFPKRVIAMLLSFVMVMSFMPSLGITARAAANDTVADAGTINDWTDFFPTTGISTEHAGGIWTDKSVFTSATAATAFAGIDGLSVTEGNFLVALSALGSNSIVVGQSTKPTDTVFVLDVSGSMTDTSGAVSSMVRAANDAIRSLMAANDQNRVGVVLYSDEVTTLLPLDSYTGVTWTETGTEFYFITTGSGDNISITTNIPTYVESGDSGSSGGGGCNGGGNNGSNQTTETHRATGSNGEVSGVTREVVGGTYIQGGLWEAWENHFSTASNASNYTPSIVLMSDGAPTYNSSAFDNVNEDDPTHGAGNNSFAGDGFVTQLTAAVVKAKVAEKYGAQAYMYTIGFGLDAISGTRNKAVATAVLDPTDSPYEDITNYWTTYKALATTSSTMTVGMGVNGDRDNDSTTNVTISKSAVAVNENYVDKFFAADDASSLSSVFQNIVNEINLQSGYYPTRLDDNGTNHSGYVTFVDEIGTGMAVKDIRGILVGSELYTGKNIAHILWNTNENNKILKSMNNGVLPAEMTAEMEAALKYDLWLGTRYQPTALGDEFVWAVMQRMGITKDQAWILIGNAWNDGQLSYTPADPANNVEESFSNYIGWYGDAEGNYLGPWDRDGEVAVPEGAEYINMCYGMVGTTSASSLASDMMYITIQISHKITTDEQIVTFRIPASLLPTVTYRVNVTLDDNNKIVEDDKATIEYVAADPIRLVYEVGVNEDLVDEITIAQYGTRTGDGKYYLYTNQWHADTTGDTANDHIAYSYFEGSEENEHYYFTEATPLYTYDGTNYNLATSYTAGTDYYYRHRTFVANGTINSEGAYPAKFDYHYGKIDPSVAANASVVSGVLTVAKGTVRQNMDSHDLAKTETGGNATGTYGNVRFQMVSDTVAQAEDVHHYELTYLGNNGRLTYEPATGISITKNMVSGVHADGVKFPFTIETATSGLQYKLQSADGTMSGYTPVSETDTAVKVEIEAGQTLYITGMDPGAEYTVTEDYIDGYQVSSTSNASGTASKGTLKPVIFTNDEWDLSFLSITKDVTYNGGVSKPATLPEFGVTVTLTKAINQQPYTGTVSVNGVDTNVTNGVLELTITDGEVKTITGIPVGVTYTVTESSTLPTGYTGVTTSASGTIDIDGNLAALVNEYTPDGIIITSDEPGISIDLVKTFFVNEGSGNGYWFNRGKTFEFELLEYVGGSWVPVTVNGNAVKTSVEFWNPYYGTTEEKGTNVKNTTLSMVGVPFDTAGSHYFRVAEVIPATIEAGFTYDRTYHDFEVVVVDDHASGKLVIKEVKSLQHATVTGPTDTNSDGKAENWNVSTSFYNSKIVGSTKLTFQANKTLVDITGGSELKLTLKDGQFDFALYQTDSTFAIDGLDPIDTEKNGITGTVPFATINYQFTENGPSKTYYYVIKETSTSGNGITVDGNVYKIAVTVVQDGSVLKIDKVLVNGVDKTAALDANNILNGDTIAFKNTYKAEAYTDDALTVRKALEDHTPGASNAAMSLADWDFSFTLSGSGENQTEQNDDSGIVTFDKITYTAAGTYTYTITENDPGKAGITVDSSVFVVTIVVKDDGKGSLYIDSKTITRDGVPVDHIEFRNVYKAVPPTEPGGDQPGNGSPVEVVLSGVKALQLADGKNLVRTIQPGEFSFVLKDADGNEIETVSNDENGNFSFSALKFDALDAYTYTISEVKGNAGGIGYSDQIYTVTVTVTDVSKDGVMEVKVDGAADIRFVNTYDVSDTTLDMTANKHLAGRPQTPGEFTFTLTALNGAPMPAGVTTTVDATNLAGGAVNFGTITYSAAGEYQYTIVENKPDGYVADANGLYNGVKYDDNEYEVTVTVEDKLDGTLYAYVSKVEANDTETTLDIHNRYEIHDEEYVNLEASKVVTDTTSETPKTVLDFFGQFSFLLTDGQGNVVQTKTNNGRNGGVIFDTLRYSAPALEVYWIEEVAGNIPGVTYDPSAYRVTIEITDNKFGGLNQKVVYEKLIVDSNGDPVLDADGNFTFEPVNGEPAFKNYYQAEASEPITITGFKKFPGGRDIVDGEFEFVLTKPDGTTETKGNVGYLFSFDPITYTTEGTYVYTLVEKIEGIGVDADGNYIKDGVKYDPTEFTITVTVTDVNGKLVAASDVKQTGGSESLTEYGFTNVFIPEAVSTTVNVKKLLDNLSDEAMGLDGFVFELYCVDTEKTLTATSDVDGNAAFGLTFTGADVGKTYEYRLSEDDSADVEGMTYDPTVYTIFVTVGQDNTTGALSLAVKCGTEALEGALVFENTYDPPVPPTTTEEEPPTTTEEEPPTTTEEEPPTTTEEESPMTTEEEPPATTEEEPSTTTGEETPETSEPEPTQPTEKPDQGNDDEPPKTMDETDLIGWAMMMSVSAICLLAVLVLGKKLVFEGN